MVSRIDSQPLPVSVYHARLYPSRHDAHSLLVDPVVLATIAILHFLQLAYGELSRIDDIHWESGGLAHATVAQKRGHRPSTRQWIYLALPPYIMQRRHSGARRVAGVGTTSVAMTQLAGTLCLELERVR